MQTKEQKRAAFALKKIQEDFNNNLTKETSNFLVGLPTMILVNGLGQTMAFLLSKKAKKSKKEEKDEKNEKYEKSFKIIKEWLIKEDTLFNKQTETEFLETFTALEPKQYIDFQKEVLAMLLWLKRYARAFQKN